MSDTVKPFNGTNWGKDTIILPFPAVEMRPIQIHLKEDGDVDGNPSFDIVMLELALFPFAVHGQISLRMINEGLADIGYELIKKPIEI